MEDTIIEMAKLAIGKGHECHLTKESVTIYPRGFTRAPAPTPESLFSKPREPTSTLASTYTGSCANTQSPSYDKCTCALKTSDKLKMSLEQIINALCPYCKAKNFITEQWMLFHADVLSGEQ